MKNIKKYLKTILIVLALGGLAYLVYLGKVSPGDGSFSRYSVGGVNILEHQQDLGDISMKNGEKEVWFTLENTSKEPVELGNATTSCMCTNAYLIAPDGEKSRQIQMHSNLNLHTTINPGEKYQVLAVFDPNAHGPDATGPIHRSVYITTNSSKTPNLELSFYGNVIK